MTQYNGDLKKFADKLKETLKVKDILFEGGCEGNKFKGLCIQVSSQKSDDGFYTQDIKLNPTLLKCAGLDNISASIPGFQWQKYDDGFSVFSRFGTEEFDNDILIKQLKLLTNNNKYIMWKVVDNDYSEDDNEDDEEDEEDEDSNEHDEEEEEDEEEDEEQEGDEQPSE
jgi:hypothetical protein